MKDLKDIHDLEMSEKEELDFLPSGSSHGEVKSDGFEKKNENSVDGKESLISDLRKDREKDIDETADRNDPDWEGSGGELPGRTSHDEGTDFLVKIPEEIKNRLPEDFNFNDIGSIDLKEAEAIANEEILFLTEDDLIEGLEDFDLIPLKDELPVKEETVPEKKKESTFPATLKKEKLPDIKIKLSPGEDASLIDKVHETVIEEKKKPSAAGIIKSIQEDIKPSEVTDAPKTGEKETLSGVAFQETGSATDTLSQIPRDPGDSLAGKIESWEGKKTGSPESDPFILKSGAEIVEESSGEQEPIPEELKGIGSGRGNIVFFDDLPVDAPSKSRHFDQNELEKATSDIVEITGRNVKFLTETGITRAMESHRFLTLMKESAAAQPDILIDFADFDYKYRDSELEFIDGAIFEEDYAKYIREIDDFFIGGTVKKSSAALEIFGMDQDEDGVIFDRMFGEDYRNVDLDKEVDLFRSDFGIIDLSITKERFFNYLLPSDESLTDFERLSIEEDISSRGAIIYEEDIEEVKRLFGREVAEPGADDTSIIHGMKEDDRFASEFGIEIEITDHEGNRLERAVKPDAITAVPETPRASGEETGRVAAEDEIILDITDKIVILEDDLDIDRFVKEFPEKKASDLKGLLKYLDGLFEKLPESTIRNFANSEYFDLYVKILSDMGI